MTPVSVNANHAIIRAVIIVFCPQKSNYNIFRCVICIIFCSIPYGIFDVLIFSIKNRG